MNIIKESIEIQKQECFDCKVGETVRFENAIKSLKLLLTNEYRDDKGLERYFKTEYDYMMIEIEEIVCKLLERRVFRRQLDWINPLSIDVFNLNPESGTFLRNYEEYRELVFNYEAFKTSPDDEEIKYKENLFEYKNKNGEESTFLVIGRETNENDVLKAMEAINGRNLKLIYSDDFRINRSKDFGRIKTIYTLSKAGKLSHEEVYTVELLLRKNEKANVITGIGKGY